MKFIRKKIIILTVLLSSVCLWTSFIPVASSSTDELAELVNSVLSSISSIKTLRYNLSCNERINGKMAHTESSVKLQLSPRKLYLSLRGPELLWMQGENNGNALVNPDAFPYMNLNLDPYGQLMRKDQHHTIHEMGMHYLADILKDGVRKAGDKLGKYFMYLGEEKYENRTCYKLSISFPEFSWSNYTVKQGETLVSIARKLYLSEYMILENNPEFSWYTDVKAGQVIKVPSAYAKLTLLMVDKELMLPVSNKVFDDKGLFETYEYHGLILNSTIQAEEFTKQCKDYHF